MVNSKLLSLQACSSSKGGKFVVYLAVVSDEETKIKRDKKTKNKVRIKKRSLNEAIKKNRTFNVECIVKMGW